MYKKLKCKTKNEIPIKKKSKSKLFFIFKVIFNKA